MRAVEQFLQIPLPDQQRKRTDIACTILGVILPVLLFCWALVDLNKQHILRVNFPADSQGAVCGIDYPTKPYLHFPDPYDPLERICVSKCPYSERFVKKTSVTPFSVTRTEEVKLNQRRKDNFCNGRDPLVRRIVQRDANRNTRRTFFNVWQAVVFALGMSILVGIVYLLLIQILPRIINMASIALGGLGSICLGVLIYKSTSHLKHNYYLADRGLALFFVLAGVAVIVSAIVRMLQVKINGVFVEYSTLVVKSVWPLLLYVPMFLILVAGLVALTLFQLFAFWSKLPPVFNPHSLYWLLQSSQFLVLKMTLVGVQLIWGLNFIAQSFNFVVSGVGVEYYFGFITCFRPFLRLLKYHWGSVVGGSFLIGFFGMFDAFFDFFKPVAQNSNYALCCSNYFAWVYDFFDIVRHDAMAYINLTGLPYCNSARYCDFLSVNTPLFGGSQSISRLFRFSGHLLLTSIVTILGIFYGGYTTFYSLGFTILITYFVVEMFASLHANIAEGICISFLAEEYLESGDFTNVKRAPLGLVDQIRRVVHV